MLRFELGRVKRGLMLRFERVCHWSRTNVRSHRQTLSNPRLNPLLTRPNRLANIVRLRNVAATGHVLMYAITGKLFQIESTRPACSSRGWHRFRSIAALGGFCANGDSAVLAAHIICRRNLFPQKFRCLDFCILAAHSNPENKREIGRDYFRLRK